MNDPTNIGAGIAPPNNVEAEGAVLSAILNQGSRIDDVIDTLRDDYFYSEGHRQIFAAMVSLHLEGQPIGLVTVSARLRDRLRLAQVGGSAYLTELMNCAESLASARAYATIVADKAKARELIAACQRIVATGYTDYGTTRDFLDQAEATIHKIAHSDATSDFEQLSVVVKRSFQRKAEQGARGATCAGIPTGFDALDRKMGGLQPSQHTIIAAETGMGKTALALNIATHVAKLGYWVPFFSLEMDNEEQADRIACGDASVDMAKLRNVALSPSEWQRLTGAATALSRVPLYLHDGVNLSVMTIRAKLRRFIADAARAQAKVGAVFVDYLQLVQPVDKHEKSREVQVSAISRGLKLLAMEFKLPVIALAQLNRAAGGAGGGVKRPDLSRLRESGAVEQNANNVIFIHREDYGQKRPGYVPTKDAEIIIAKQRSGPTGVVRVRFDREFTRFADAGDEVSHAAE